MKITVFWLLRNRDNGLGEQTEERNTLGGELSLKKILVFMTAGVMFLGGCGKSGRPVHSRIKSHPVGAAAAKANPSGQGPVATDYSRVPVYTPQGKLVYVDAKDTALLFFATWCPHCKVEVPEVQKELKTLGSTKPIVLVSTFLHTNDVSQAIYETDAFMTKYRMNLPWVIQSGDPQIYVKRVPTLVWYEDPKVGASGFRTVVGGTTTTDLREALVPAAIKGATSQGKYPQVLNKGRS